MDWYIKVLKQYAVFGGRAQRKEYWFFVLFNTLVSIGLTVIDGATGTLNAGIGMGLLSGVYSLAVFIPSLAVTVRRLHDTGRSGWWLLIVLIPLIGALALLAFLIFDSQPDENQYGANPKALSV